MTQEQKAAVAYAADNINETLSVYASYYAHIVAGMQHVIDNPGEFGLTSVDNHEKMMLGYEQANLELEEKLTKYREALERLLEENMCSHAGDELIEEALKHESKD